MEQEKKNCPYCGEEIMASAKKCKHCGEWLTEKTNVQVPQYSVEKETSFSSDYLYDRTLMKIILWATLVGAFIQALHQSGVAQDIIISGSARIRLFWGIIKFLSDIPEVIGDILFGVGETCIFYMLMKVFSNLHKPLTSWFVAYLIINIVMSFIVGTIEETNEGMLIAFLSAVIYLIITIALGAIIVYNYEEEIRTLGWIIIIYSICSIIFSIVIENIAYPFIAFIILFGMDYLYLNYLCNKLSKS